MRMRSRSSEPALPVWTQLSAGELAGCGRGRARRAPFAGFNRVRFQGFLSIPARPTPALYRLLGIPLAAVWDYTCRSHDNGFHAQPAADQLSPGRRHRVGRACPGAGHSAATKARACDRRAARRPRAAREDHAPTSPRRTASRLARGHGHHRDHSTRRDDHRRARGPDGCPPNEVAIPMAAVRSTSRGCSRAHIGCGSAATRSPRSKRKWSFARGRSPMWTSRSALPQNPRW